MHRAHVCGALPIPIFVLTLIDPFLLVVTFVAKATLAPAHEVRMKVIDSFAMRG